MKQPVTVGVAAVNWGDYMGGVYPNELCDGDIDHAVLLVGWGVDAGLGASWKMKNSWGVGWGEDGYIRLQRNGKFCTIDSAPGATAWAARAGRRRCRSAGRASSCTRRATRRASSSRATPPQTLRGCCQHPRTADPYPVQAEAIRAAGSA